MWCDSVTWFINVALYTAASVRREFDHSREPTMKNMIAGFFLLLAVPIYAAPNVVVQGIQMSAWLQRGATTQPLSIGMELNDGDKLITGANARILLQAADGSAIKLGENAVSRLQQDTG